VPDDSEAADRGPAQIRDAGAADAGAIAALHADSWRRHYRGAFSDEFLDGDVLADRTALWTARLAAPGHSCTLVADSGNGDLVGFAHTVFGEDPTWGALVDNLHVRHQAKRGGVGSSLLAETARRVVDQDESSGLYLWVLEQNREAQAFYRARGGAFVGRRTAVSPGGVAGRLSGAPVALRCAWRHPRRLFQPQE
jgi:ribosomal protein S18 acetylase RimI-like enzyme